MKKREIDRLFIESVNAALDGENISLSQLSADSGIHISTISRILAGKSGASEAVQNAISASLSRLAGKEIFKTGTGIETRDFQLILKKDVSPEEAALIAEFMQIAFEIACEKIKRGSK